MKEIDEPGARELGLADATGDAEESIAAFLTSLLPSVGERNPAAALLPWFCDVLLSSNSRKAYASDLAHFAKHMAGQGVHALSVSADHIKLYKAAMLHSAVRPATIARRLSVIRGVYKQFAEKALIDWTTSQRIDAVKAPPVQRNTTPGLTEGQAIALLNAVPVDTLQGLRDLAMLQTFFVTGCRVSAIIGARVGDLEYDGIEHYLNVTEKRRKRARKILLDAAKCVYAYIQAAEIADELAGPLFRPLRADLRSFADRHMDRKTPWRLVKNYCRIAGVSSERLGQRGIGVHSLRKTAITNAIRNGAGIHEVREFAGHADIRTTELYYSRRSEDAEVAARRIAIRRA